VILEARAKLTLCLHVLGTRDDGFHELEALTVSLSAPSDRVEIEPAAAMSLTIDGPAAHGVPADATNLAWRAAEAVGQTFAIRIHKQIPSGAGLGGGSADAAAILVACDADASVGAALGSDVPFCMRGGAAWMRGRGEIIEPATLPARTFVVAVPPFGCSTPAVYRAWDDLGGPIGRTVDVDGLPPLRNDLEPAAEHVEPRLRMFREQLEAATGATALLAGSGSSYVVPWTRDDAPAIEAAAFTFVATTA
jgi:4-diphosphocytidyl-2-C-methyl-D-erythritol kinase